jgi:hypothetical protein
MTHAACLATRAVVIDIRETQITPIAKIESPPLGRTGAVSRNMYDTVLIASAYPDLVLTGMPVRT